MQLQRRIPAALLGAAIVGAAIMNWPNVAYAQSYDVTGVASDDVLHLRAQPATKARIVDALAPTTTDIMVERRQGNWAYIRYRNKSGWVDARYLRLNPASLRTDVPMPLKCEGDEPYWSATLDGASLQVNLYGTVVYAGTVTLIRRSENEPGIWLIRPSDGPVSSIVVRSVQACRDETDQTFQYAGTAETRDGKLYSACCFDARRPH